MMAALSCSGHVAIAPEDSFSAPESTPTSEPAAQEPDEPDALVGMWDPDPAFPGQRRLEGILHIEHPCVYLLGHANWDAILISLPRDQTDYDTASDSVTVAGHGPLASGDRITAVGSYSPHQSTDDCPNDASFKAWQLHRSADPFVGMYDPSDDGMAPDHYWIGILLIEPPCAFLVSHSDQLLGIAHDVYMEPELLLLARNIRYDRESKSIQDSDGRRAFDGDVVVVGPGLGRDSSHAKICPSDTQVSADYVITAHRAAYLDAEERQYVESLRGYAAALFAPTTHQRPCERLGVCPKTPLPPSR